MKAKPATWYFIAAAFLVVLFFSITLETGFYVYCFYMIIGAFFYILSKSFGREIYFLLLAPILFISVNLLGSFLILDYFDSNGTNPLKLHPVTICWLVIFTLEMLETILSRGLKPDYRIMAGASVIILFLFFTYLKRGTNGIPLAIENYLSPISFYIFTVVRGGFDIARLKRFMKFIIVIGVIAGLFGMFEYIMQSNFLNTIYFNTSTWYESTFENGYRIKTFIGHPLNNAMLFLFMMILTSIVEKKLFRKNILLLFFLIAIVLTGSRSFAAVGVLVIVFDSGQRFVENKSWREYAVRFLLTGSCALVIFFTPLGSTLTTRLVSEDISTQPRLVLADYFVKNLAGLSIQGLGASTDNMHLYTEKGQRIILENPWIILFFDMSWLALIYLFFLVSAIKEIDYKLSVLFLVLGLSASNSFGVRSTANYFLYFLISYCYAAHVNKHKEGISNCKAVIRKEVAGIDKHAAGT